MAIGVREMGATPNWVDDEVALYRTWLEDQARDVAKLMTERHTLYGPAGSFDVITFADLQTRASNADARMFEALEEVDVMRRILARAITHCGVANMPAMAEVADWDELLADLITDAYPEPNDEDEEEDE